MKTYTFFSPLKLTSFINFSNYNNKKNIFKYPNMLLKKDIIF